MSQALIDAALETALNGITPALATAWENVPFTPVPGTPYQAVYIIPAEPNELGHKTTMEYNGIMQVSLFYPLATGASTKYMGKAAARAQAKLITDMFYRSADFVSGGVRVYIKKSWQGQGRNEGDRYHLPVKIYYKSRF